MRTVIFLDDVQTMPQLIEAFHLWLEQFDAVDDERRLLSNLCHCRERLPARLQRDFDLPSDSTYGVAAELFLSLWVDTEFRER